MDFKEKRFSQVTGNRGSDYARIINLIVFRRITVQ